MKKNKKIGIAELIKIEMMLEKGYTNTEIGVEIGKDGSSIWRLKRDYPEIKEKHGWEKVWEKKYELRHKKSGERRIMSDELLEKFVLEKVLISWSPAQIANRWKSIHKESLSPDTVRSYVLNNKPELVKLCFRRKGKKYKKVASKKERVFDGKKIETRPVEVELRKRLGHWEGDTIVGKNHQQGIVTNVERMSGYLLAQKTKRRTAELTADVTRDMFEELPDKLKLSITYDRGSEFAWHSVIAAENNIEVYFADAGKPWQRGSNENTNGLLRQFIPKGTDFDTVSDADLEYYVHLINNRPRKRLNWKTPFEVFNNIDPFDCVYF